MTADGYMILPPEGAFHWNTRWSQLESLAEEFWPGKEDDIRAFRTWNVWRQVDQECPWDRYEELEPDRDPIDTGADAVAELATIDLVPALSGVGHLGDNLRAELKRQGRTLEELCLSLRPPFEKLPWHDMYPADYRREVVRRSRAKREK